MPTVVGILTFMSKKNFMLSRVEHESFFVTSGLVYGLRWGCTLCLWSLSNMNYIILESWSIRAFLSELQPLIIPTIQIFWQQPLQVQQPCEAAFSINWKTLRGRRIQHMPFSKIKKTASCHKAHKLETTDPQTSVPFGNDSWIIISQIFCSHPPPPPPPRLTHPLTTTLIYIELWRNPPPPPPPPSLTHPPPPLYILSFGRLKCQLLKWYRYQNI